jgi:hypothetical protein
MNVTNPAPVLVVKHHELIHCTWKKGIFAREPEKQSAEIKICLASGEGAEILLLFRLHPVML